MDIVTLLKAERDKMARQLSALDAATQALSGSDNTRSAARGPLTMSAASRAKISAAQKARWAKVKGQKVPIKTGKRHISAAGLARIRAATRARWARWRREKRAA